MDRQQAVEALQLLKKVVSQVRDDTALENWGMAWIVGGITNGGAFVATHFMLAAGIGQPLPFMALWLPVLALNAGAMLIKQRGGPASFVEAQVWNIWNTFTGAMILTGLVNWLLGLNHLFMAPVAAILAAFAFSMMGSLMGRWWFVPAFICCVTAIVTAFLPGWQFLLFGVVWGLVQCSNGLALHLARLRKLATAEKLRLV